MADGKQYKSARILLAAAAIYLLPSLANSMAMCDELCPTKADLRSCNQASCGDGDTDSCTWWINSKNRQGKCESPQAN